MGVKIFHGYGKSKAPAGAGPVVPCACPVCVASLSTLPGMDEYIAQIWTGTSREPVYYNGVKKERVFENAFQEYGSMLSMTAPTGRIMYFLTDP